MRWLTACHSSVFYGKMALPALAPVPSTWTEAELVIGQPGGNLGTILSCLTAVTGKCKNARKAPGILPPHPQLPQT